jgi:Alternative oxidase
MLSFLIFGNHHFQFISSTSTYNRLDTEELKHLLQKHNSTFSDEEIVEIGELFYAGKSGGSVSFRRFVEAIDRVLQVDQQGKDTGDKASANNPLDIGNCANEYLFFKHHGSYTPEELDVNQTHIKPESLRDRLAYNCVKIVRVGFDTATGWNYNKITPEMVLNRTIFLETIAAVPGMVAAIVRHFRSLRNFSRDNGMMQMFLDEA